MAADGQITFKLRRIHIFTSANKHYTHTSRHRVRDLSDEIPCALEEIAYCHKAPFHSLPSLIVCPWICKISRAKAPLVAIYNPYSKHIGVHVLPLLSPTYTHTLTIAWDSCSGDHDTAACGILWADMLTPVYSIYRTDRKANAHTHNQDTDEDIC